VKVDFADCPVEASLGVLGKKWTMLIIRDIGAYGVDRFSGLRKSLPGIAVKVLATRLKELEQEGFTQKNVEKSVPPKIIRWSLTEKGIDAIRVGMILAAFGSRWYANRVFYDKRPRGMSEIYTREGLELFMKIF
jgi:DNA-binding HxlR family transcriptional regulator